MAGAMAKDLCVPSDLPCRANLELMPREATIIAMWALTAVALAIAAYGVWEMVQVWRKGRDWKPGDWRRGLRRLVAAMLTHRKFMQDRKPGTMHAWIFFGFVVLFIGTTLAFIDMDIFELILGAKLLKGNFYLWYEAILDAFGVVLILGVLYAFKRRWVDKPPQLHPSAHPEAPVRLRGDTYALWFLLLIAVTGFLLEGMRLRHQIDDQGISHASWSFVGALVAVGFEGWSTEQLMTYYPVLWWLHFALWTSVLAVLPWTKFKHIITSSLNVYFHDPERLARPALTTPFDLQKMMESGDADFPSVGVSTIRDFTWKNRLALDACTNCGRCESQCPATAAGRPLSPRKLIQDLKAHMWQDHRAEAKAKRVGKEYASPKLTVVDGLATSIEEATLWSCTTCRACMTECPVDINHVDMIVDMRRALVMDSKLDEHQQKLLVNLTNAGNPYGFPMADRDAWRSRLPDGVEVPLAAEKHARGEPIDVLWWVGCVGSFDPRNQQVTRAIATIYNAAGVQFAILGNEERCNGDPARRLGEEGRFQQSALENLAVLQQYGVKRIVTQCPHCFNTLQNEYPQFGGTFQVQHHSQFIEELLEAERIPLKDAASMKVAFHDSCYLGRHNGIYDAPRKVLGRSGLPVLEMAQSREQGLCCGAGGSNMWYEVGREKERINVIRARQAADTGADTVASACPFCLTMLSDGIGLTGNEDKMKAKDIAEIVFEHLAWPREDAADGATPAGDPPASPTDTPPSGAEAA
jgi:Fe-S oxidoreductase/nitrate reductase gamma subunit